MVNTCTVTDQADADALRLIRRIARRNPAARLIVTGCLATRDPQAILAAAQAAVVVGNDRKGDIPSAAGCAAAPLWPAVTGLGGRSRAFVKIQDGCNMSCAFCIVPAVRPRLWSKPLPELEAEVRGLVAAGAPEVVLCGVRLGRYQGEDAGRRVDLPALLERLCGRLDSFRLRLSSLEVTDVGERLLDLMAGSGGRICPSLHVPLQSGSETVLRRMRRWHSAAFYRRRAEAFLAKVRKAALFADVIAGFPGETEAEFEETARLVETLGFSGLHVFRYSPRRGTGAAALKPLAGATVRRRAERLRGIDGALRSRFAARAVGQRRQLAVERDGAAGLSEDFLTVRLASPASPGLISALIERADGQQAWGRPEGPGAPPRSLL